MLSIEEIQKDLSYLVDREVVLFGSYVSGNAGPRSDIDVAIIARTRNRDEMLQIRIRAAGRAPEGYDIQVFEALPLIIKGSILDQYKVLFGDPLEIGMYFRNFRKVWEDYRHRIEIPTVEEIRAGIAKTRQE